MEKSRPEKCTRDEKWQRKLKALEEKAKFYQLHHLVPEYKPRLTEPLHFWKVFYRQKDALERAILASEDVHVFAFEPVGDSPGKRRFLVTSYPELWHNVQSLYTVGKPGTYYEIITEGAVCKLYFDLEYLREFNPGHDGEEMVADLIKIVIDKLQSVYNIQCSSRDVLILDASTEAKFSAHLIFNLRNATFKDNINVGNFVHQLCDEIRDSEEEEVPSKRSKVEQPEGESEDPPCRESALVVRNSEGKESLFIDEGVYTKNRNFRLYKCVKSGKDNPLLIAEYNEYEPKIGRRQKMSEDKRIFMDSLITNIKCTPDTRILTSDDPSNRHSSTVLNPVMSSSGDPSDLSSKLEGYGHNASPFPDLDAFVTSVVTEGGVQGAVRQWVYFAESHTVLYEIFKNRWCGNIRRAHRSNNIMILVNLKSRTFYQKCHDPDCKGYKSEERPLPIDCLPITDDYDDEELLEALDQIENVSDHDTETGTNGQEGEEIMEAGELNDVADITDEELSEAYDRMNGTGGEGMIQFEMR